MIYAPQYDELTFINWFSLSAFRLFLLWLAHTCVIYTYMTSLKTILTIKKATRRRHTTFKFMLSRAHNLNYNLCQELKKNRNKTDISIKMYFYTSVLRFAIFISKIAIKIYNFKSFARKRKKLKIFGAYKNVKRDQFTKRVKLNRNSVYIKAMLFVVFTLSATCSALIYCFFSFLFKRIRGETPWELNPKQ